MSEFSELWSGLDHEKIAVAIGPDLMPDYDFEDAKLCVYSAAERWLVRDVEEFHITGIERLHRSTNAETVFLGGFKGYLDIEGSVNGHCKEFAALKGNPFILDWKTSRVLLDATWKNRQVDSWQWRAYSAMSGAKLFFYRGIRRPKKVGEEVDLREVILEVPENNAEETWEHINGLLIQRKALIDAKLLVWPRNKPDACNEWNRLCPRYIDCSEFTMPRLCVDNDREMSYSRLKTFMLCPERHRRDILDANEGIDEEDSDMTSFGKAVHRGLAELYSQVFGVTYEGRG